MPILRPIIVALLPFILAIAYSAATCADFGDAQTEILGVQILRGHTTTGSGGHAATPVSLSRLGGARAASSVCAINNTTVATGGSPKTLRSEVFNVAAGYLYEPPQGRSGQIGGLWRSPALATEPALVFPEAFEAIRCQSGVAHR